MGGIRREQRRRNLSVLIIDFDPTVTPADTGKVLPKGAVPLMVQPLGGATGGSSPTVHVGVSGNDDGFADELDADTLGAPVANGALLGTALAAATPVFAGVGASAATGGTARVAIYYAISDADGAGE